MGGATISFLNLILNLDKSVFKPVVVLPENNKRTDLEFILEENKIDYHYVFLVSSVLREFHIKNSIPWIVKYIYLPFKKYRSYKSLKRLFLSVTPDIIHTNVGLIHEGYHIAKKYNIPHVWHLREYQTLDFKLDIYPSYRSYCSYLKNSYVITITEAIYHYFKLEKNNKAFPIYNGIFRVDDCLELRPKENYFLMASRISPEKGHIDVIRAFSSFSKKDFYRIKIAGFSNDPAYLEELKAVVCEYKCEDRVQKDIKPLMSKAKALIVASYNEGFGRMTAEAAFCNTIVIGRNTAGTKEILSKTGGLPFNNVTEMTNQMEAISTMSHDEYKIMAQKAQKVAIDCFSIESNVNQVQELYKSIVQ